MTNKSNSGFKWGPFTTYIPFVHTRPLLPEFLQGLVMLAATGLAIAPLLMNSFGLSFEEAVAMSMIQGIIISSGWLLFGMHASPGWITPALPMVLAAVTQATEAPAERFQIMTAMAILFALLLALIGMSKKADSLYQRLPPWLISGVLIGAALAAFIKVLDLSDARNIFNVAPWVAITSLPLAVIVCFHGASLAKILPRSIAVPLVQFGMLFAIFAAVIVGQLTGELSFSLTNEWFIPPVGSLWAKVSPWVIGWPSLDNYLTALPVVLITYILLCSDLVTLKQLNKPVQQGLPNDADNLDAMHGALAVRNLAMSMMSPFFSTQGPLWTGVHGWLVQRQQDFEASNAATSTDGRETRLIDRISSYYLFAIPVAYLVSPLMLLLKPLMAITLALTLTLTGYACAKASGFTRLASTQMLLAAVVAISLVTLPAIWAVLLIAALYALYSIWPLSSAS